MNLICGINPVLEALAAGTRHFDRLLVVKGLRNPRVAEAISRAAQRGVPLRFEARETLDRMASGVAHQGVVAVVSAKPTIDLETLLQHARQPALVMALDGVEDPRNLGAILRSVEAAGGDGVLLPDRHSVGLTETVARASAGALEHVKVARIGNLAQAIETLKERGLWVIGFDATGSERWDRIDYKRPVALVLGGEGRGLRRLVRERCDQVASIPLFGHLGSLNVGVAAGIALYEVVRQRGNVPSHVRPIAVGAKPPVRQIEGPPAGDAEHDPGAGRSFSETAAEPDDLEPMAPIRIIDYEDEDVAWARTATAPGPADRDSGPRGENGPRREGPRREGPRRDSGPARDSGPRSERGGPPPSRASGPDADRRAGRRNKRRRGRRPGPEGRPPGQQRNGVPESQPGGPPAPPKEEGAPGPRQSRHRRRRVRRRGGGPAGGEGPAGGGGEAA